MRHGITENTLVENDTTDPESITDSDPFFAVAPELDFFDTNEGVWIEVPAETWWEWFCRAGWILLAILGFLGSYVYFFWAWITCSC